MLGRSIDIDAGAAREVPRRHGEAAHGPCLPLVYSILPPNGAALIHEYIPINTNDVSCIHTYIHTVEFREIETTVFYPASMFLSTR